MHARAKQDYSKRQLFSFEDSAVAAIADFYTNLD
jgi:hypothetical protein